MKDYFIKEKVDPIISGLCRDIKPITILLITKQGTVISEAGDTKSINTTAMAALTAGMFSATREVAKMVGEQQFSILLQQGEKRHIHISLVTEDAMMIIVFEDYRRIGMVRVEAKKAGTRLIDIAMAEKAKDTDAAFAAHHPSTSTNTNENQDARNKDGKISTPEFKEYALNLIDQIFVTKT
ncbi:MAG: roadblock/LC7 domain-containing protein [Deltaproteobacteria bacterium]|nr:roadblock/LC7 domain-containing protein [Deltaproteobacteria bacterium]MBN2673643.1 roadblock/LC7 domain-containing protein [Deltaproteobacteria bacterium]